jgi:hypothetical protein
MQPWELIHPLGSPMNVLSCLLGESQSFLSSLDSRFIHFFVSPKEMFEFASSYNKTEFTGRVKHIRVPDYSNGVDMESFEMLVARQAKLSPFQEMVRIFKYRMAKN